MKSKRIFWSFLTSAFSLLLLFSACKEDQPEPEEVRSVRYELLSGSDWNYQGEALFEEAEDGSTLITIKLEGVQASGEVYFPVHLHRGPYQQEAEMAAMLEPVNGKTGKSITHLKHLANGSPVNYEELLGFDGHIKVHLGESGEDKKVVLAYGNIGANK